MVQIEIIERTAFVKIMVGVNCVALVIFGFIGIFSNIFSIITNPTRLVLAAYICLFGLVATAAELGLSFAKEHFGFLRYWIGEAVFFIFIGTLGISFGTDSIMLLVVGIYSCVVGIVCIIDHFACGRKFLQDNNEAPQ